MNEFQVKVVIVRWLIVLLVGIMVVNTTLVSAEIKEGTQVPQFTLKNINDKEFSLKDMEDKPVVLIIGGRKAKDEISKWEKIVEEKYDKGTSTIRILSIATIKIPFFIPKGWVRREIRKDNPPDFLLLDWEGKVSDAYGVKDDSKPNIFLIDKTGRLYFTLVSNFSSKDMEKLIREIENLLNDKMSIYKEGDKK